MKRRHPRLKATFALAFILSCLLSLAACGDGFYDSAAVNGLLPGRTQAEIDSLNSEKVPDGMLQVSINSNPVFLNGTERGNLRIENAPGNSRDFRVTITLTDSGEVVYSSGGIKPNQHIENAALDVDLEAGTYAATAKFYAVDEKHKDLGLVSRDITLNVLE